MKLGLPFSVKAQAFSDAVTENPSGVMSGLSVLDSRISQKDNQLGHI